MSLREILDLPGFTFLLAFDEEIVARALTDANPAWLEGSNFLEKILDFRYYLPAITLKQKERLLNVAMKKYCPFVPQESTGKVLDLLPDNTRKLKSLIRSLTSLQLQVARHDPDELNWIDMWLAQMLRHESYPFVDLLLESKALEEVAGYLYSLKRKRSERAKEDEPNEQLKTLFEQGNINDPVLLKRLTRLVEACRSRSSQHFRYMCELAIRPQALTWKEFRAIRATWQSDPKPSVLADVIAKHAVEKTVGAEDVESEFFDALLGARSRVLEQAAESKPVPLHQSFANQASELLSMVKQFLGDLGYLDATRFEKLYGQVSYWIGFRKNPADLALRNEEEASLLELISNPPAELSIELLEKLLPVWDVDFGGGERELRAALRGKCRDIIALKAAKEAISFMSREGGVRSLTEPRRFGGVKYCLFNADSPVWTTDLRNELIELIRKGPPDSVVYSNASDLFDLIILALRRSGDSPIDVSNATRLASTQEFIAALWNAVTARPIQYRMQMSYVNARQLLVQNGASEAILTLTDELKLRAGESSEE